MSKIDLSKCRKGDRLVMRNGGKTTIVAKTERAYQIAEYGGWYVRRNGISFGFESHEFDIIRILPCRKPKPRKSLSRIVQFARHGYYGFNSGEEKRECEKVARAVNREVRRRMVEDGWRKSK